MPDFGLAEALSKALSAAKNVPVMRPAEQALTARGAEAAAAPAAAASGAAAIDWDDPEFKKFFTDVLTVRTPPSA